MTFKKNKCLVNSKNKIIMKKQTAVEFLGHELNVKLFYDISPELWEQVNEIFKQAKAMHKEEMKELYLSHVTKAERLKKIFEKQFEELYNETFGGKDEK